MYIICASTSCAQHCTKSHIFFFQMFWKDGLSKKLRWNMIFPVLSGKMMFFPKILPYSLDAKWKMMLLKKCMEIWYFLQMFWKDGLPKNHTGIWSFIVSSGKMIFLFPESTILFLRRKMKDNLSHKKKCVEIWYFLQMPQKDGLSKKNRAGIWSFLHYLERWFFSGKIWYFFFGKKMKDDLSQEIHDIFCIYV